MTRFWQAIRTMLFLPEQGSTFAVRVDWLHMLILGSTLLVAAVIGVVGLTWLIRYRERVPGAVTPKIKATPLQEAFIVGFPLTFFLVVFVIGYHQLVQLKRAPPDALDVYVTAKQWMWKFSYPSGPSEIGTLHVPVGRPVRALITSRDVIHSFFVPAFRMKQDAVPARYTELWFEVTQPGRYQVLCAEYCGLSHSDMRAEVVAMPREEFERWVDSQRRGTPPTPEQAAGAEAASPGAFSDAPSGDLRAAGERIAAREGCLKCHSVDGSRHIGPTWLDLYRRTETLDDGTQVTADEAYLTESMFDPRARVVRGFQPVMPNFQGRLSPAQTAALLEFIKSLRSPRPPGAGSEPPAYAPVH